MIEIEILEFIKEIETKDFSNEEGDCKLTDQDIEKETGRSIGDIFVESGEPYFRELESVAVRTALSQHSGVLALGGGAVLDANTRGSLATHTVAWLDVGLASAMSRLEMNRSRPLLLGNVRAQWQHLADQRRPLYQEVADIVVLTDGRDIDDIVATLIQDLQLPTHEVP